jgi:hypothetical protein
MRSEINENHCIQVSVFHFLKLCTSNLETTLREDRLWWDWADSPTSVFWQLHKLLCQSYENVLSNLKSVEQFFFRNLWRNFLVLIEYV